MPEQLVDSRIRHNQSSESGCEIVATLINRERRDPRQFQSIVPSSFNNLDMCTRALRVETTVRAPINSPEVTVIAWVNGNAPDLNPLPTGENSTLKGNLQNGTVAQQTACALQGGRWILGVASNISTGADAAYANAWLLTNSANTAPPSTITPLLS